MLKIRAKLLVFAMLLTLSFTVQAQADNAFGKLGRGVENIVTSPVEFIVQYAVQSQGNPIGTLVGGTLAGAGMTIVRILGGAVEVLTFPFPIPADYAPLMDPETPFKALGQINAT